MRLTTTKATATALTLAALVLAGQAAPGCQEQQVTIFSVSESLVAQTNVTNHDWETVALPSAIPAGVEALYLEVFSCGQSWNGDNYWISFRSTAPSSERDCRTAIPSTDPSCQQCYLWLPVGSDRLVDHALDGFYGTAMQEVSITIKGYVAWTQLPGRS
jgi:hypothetical protein